MCLLYFCLYIYKYKLDLLLLAAAQGTEAVCCGRRVVVRRAWRRVEPIGPIYIIKPLYA